MSNLGGLDHASRRLALNACSACRQRKTKCNEAKPRCGRCTRLELDCHYVETAASIKSAAVTEMNTTLERLESKIDYIKQFIDQDRVQPHTSARTAVPSTDVPDISPGLPKSPQVHTGSPIDSLATRSEHSPLIDKQHQEILFLSHLSHAHLTAPQYMFLWPCSPSRLRDTQLQYPISLEIGREKLLRSTSYLHLLDQNLNGLRWFDYLSTAQVHRLTQNFFEYFHPSTLIIEEEVFRTQSTNSTIMSRFPKSLDTCEVLFVLALGAIVESRLEHHNLHTAIFPSTYDIESSLELDSLALFNAGCKILYEVERADWHTVQCWLLMGLFYSANLRVYEHWSAVQRASALIMTLLPLSTSYDELHCRLYWTAYLQESQILAEFDFCPTGLRAFENAMPLPFAREEFQSGRNEDYEFFFLAQISLRRLLNRIHANLYSREDVLLNDVHLKQYLGPNAFSSRTRKIVKELNHQLDLWKVHLPVPLQFSNTRGIEHHICLEPSEPRTLRARLMGSLQSRYFAAKSIINRPYIYAMVDPTGPEPLPKDEEQARVALEAQILVALESGLLTESIATLPHPINPCRSFFAAAILVDFVNKSSRVSRSILPSNWEILHQIKEQISLQAGSASPVVAQDLQLLDALHTIS